MSRWRICFLTGQGLGEFLRERIWVPLGMKNTFMAQDDLLKRGGMDGLSQGYG
jgi:CubicO group peptidase (beta-lactamase class C family)